MTVSVKLGQKFAVSLVVGVENLKLMVVSLKLGVLAMLKAEGLWHRQNPPVSMNTIIGFQVFIPPGTREYRKISPKFHWIPSHKNKTNMSVFPLKPSFSHFSISFLLWIPSLSLSDQESRDTLPTSPYLLVLWQFSRMYSGNIDCPSRSKLLTFTYGLYICSKSGRIVSRLWKTLRLWKKASILVWFWRTTILLRKHQNC